MEGSMRLPVLIIANNRQSITINIYSSTATGRRQLTDDVTLPIWLC